MRKILFISLAAVLLTACETNKAVTFVTSTNVGVDVDANTQNVNIGFARIEGVVGPVYATGEIPPVFADIQSNAKVFGAQVSQFYATGEAAVIATSQKPPEPMKQIELKGKRKTMFFGTATVTGFKAGFAGSAPRSLTLGYKRQEFSRIPIITNETDNSDVYGSVLARIELGSDATEFKKTGMRTAQLFATGYAAENLAPIARGTVIAETEKAANFIGQYADDANSQRLNAALQQDTDGTFRAELNGWIKANALNVSVTSFVNASQFAQARQRAVLQLLGN